MENKRISQRRRLGGGTPGLSLEGKQAAVCVAFLYRMHFEKWREQDLFASLSTQKQTSRRGAESTEKSIFNA